MSKRSLTTEIITAAIDGFEAQKARIDGKIAELRAMLPGGSADPVVPEPTTRKRRKMSAAARKRMGDAQRKRWAALKGPSKPGSMEPVKPKRKLSKAGKANIVAALKRRWALKRAEAAKAKK